MPISSASSRCAVSSGFSPSLVQLAGGELEQGVVPHRLARLAHQIDVSPSCATIADRARVLDDLALGLLAVVVAEPVHADAVKPALPDHLSADPLHQSLERGLGRHERRLPQSDTVTSSIVSSASIVTDSSGWWLRSVPFARFTHGQAAPG